MKRLKDNSPSANTWLITKVFVRLVVFSACFLLGLLSFNILANNAHANSDVQATKVKTQGHTYSGAHSVPPIVLAPSGTSNIAQAQPTPNISEQITTDKSSEATSSDEINTLTYDYLIQLGHKYKSPAFRRSLHHKNNLLGQQSNASNELHKQKFQRRILAQQYITTLGHKFIALGAFTENILAGEKDNRTYGHIISKAIPSNKAAAPVGVPYKNPEPEPAIPSSIKKPDNNEITKATPLIKNSPIQSIPPMIQNNSSSAIADGEELLLVIKIDNLILDAIFAFKQGNGAYIGLDSLFSVLDFPIDVDLTNNIAAGWYIKEGQNFKANFPSDGITNGEVLTKSTSFKVQPQAYKLEGDDIYVHSSEIFKWLNFNYNINFNDLTLTIIPTEKLPLQKRLARHARQGKLSTHTQLKPILPERSTPYKAFDMPFLDVQVSTNTTQDNSVSSYSVLGMGDLAYMTARYYLNGNDTDTFANTSFTLERESLDNDLLGPLKASRVSVGDVGTVTLPFMRNSGQEVGAKISNRPIGQTTNFNTTSFDGNIFPGWDIELYHNNVLIERRIVGADGRYEFNNLNLFFGENIFKMIFYGPQGQLQERVESVPVNSNSMLEDGFLFDISVTEQSGKLLQNTNVETEASGARIAAEFEKGLTKSISLQTGYTSFEFADGSSHQLIPLGLNIYTLGAKFNIAYIKDLEGGDALDLEASTRIKSQAVNLRWINYSDDFKFDSDEADLPDSISSLRLSGPIAHFYDTNLSYSLSASQTKRFDNSEYNIVNANISANRSRFSISNSWYYSYFDFDNAENAQNNLEILNGNLQITKNFSKYRLRARADYAIKPEADLTNISATLLWPVSDVLVSEVGLNHNDISTRATVALTWDTDFANIGTNFWYDTDDNYLASLNVRFSLGQDPTTSGIKMSRNRIASGGGISARVFEDINLDGIYNEGEPLIEGAKISAVNVKRHAVSDVSGMAFLTGLPKNRVTDIQLEIDSLEDPFWLPATEGFSFNPRPGLIEVFDIPIVTSGEVDGNVYIESKGSSENGRYVPIELLNETGEVVLSEESEYDGFYLLSGVKPGSYTLRVKQSYLKRKQLTQHSTHKISIQGDGTVIRGEDILLKPILKMIHLKQASENSITVLNLGSFDTLRTLKLSWLILRKKHDILQNMQPLLPIKYIKKDKNSQRYALRLVVDETPSNAINSHNICKTLKRPADFCFIENIVLDRP